MKKIMKELAKNRQLELESDNVEVDAAHVLEVFIKALKKRRCKYELRDGGKIYFTYSRKKFYAELDCEDDFVCIYLIHDITIDKDDETKLIRLGKAVNETNKNFSANTFYEDSNDADFYFVVSRATIPFVSQNPNFEIELRLKLEVLLAAQNLMKILIKRKSTKRKKQMKINL